MTKCDEDYTAMLKSLEYQLEKQLKKNIMKEKVWFSRSLRWEVSPQDGLTEQVYMDEWLEFFNKAGRELQGLVLKRERLKMNKLNESINLLHTKLEPIKESNQYKDFNTNIKKKLEKVDRDTQRKKSEEIS